MLVSRYELFVLLTSVSYAARPRVRQQLARGRASLAARVTRVARAARVARGARVGRRRLAALEPVACYLQIYSINSIKSQFEDTIGVHYLKIYTLTKKSHSVISVALIKTIDNSNSTRNVLPCVYYKNMKINTTSKYPLDHTFFVQIFIINLSTSCLLKTQIITLHCFS